MSKNESGWLEELFSSDDNKEPDPLCYWCGKALADDQFNDLFLTGIFGYRYCSRECKEDHIASK